MRALPLLLAAALLAPALAQARAPFAAAPHLEWTGSTEGVTAKAEKAADPLDWDALSIDEKRKWQKKLELRRALVDVHTVLSFVSAGFIIASEVVGIVNSQALEEGLIPRGDLEPSLGLHRVFAGAAIGTYWSAGVTAWTMPPALQLNRAQEPKKVDSGELHAALSIIHGIAMGTVIATGILQANVIPASEAWGAVESTHAISAFTAAGTIIAAGIVIGTL